MKKFFTTAAAVLLASTAFTAEIYVDYNKGNAKNTGTKEAPFAKVRQALNKALPGDTVYILPSEKPILDNVYILNIHGTPDKPVTVDGMNNTFIGAKPLDPKQWQEVKPGIFRKQVKTGLNWSSRFYLIFDGKINRMGRIQKSPGAKPYKKVEELAPGEWTVVVGKKISDKGPHHQYEIEYFVRLPEKATGLADSGITEPIRGISDGVCVRGTSKNVVVRNMIMKNFFNDGYNIHGQCENIRFENIAALFCGDDGISAHEACTISLKNGVFIGCSTAICHVQQAKCTHDNVYAEQVVGRELYFTADSANEIKNMYFYADSYSGCAWTPRQAANTQNVVLENIYAISNNPKAVFVKSGKGKLEAKISNVQLAGFHKVMNESGIQKVEADAIREKIENAKKSLFALFNGKLEKML